MPSRRRPTRSRALLVGACALLAGASGCGREKRVRSPEGLYKYGIPRPPDLTPVVVPVTSASPAQAPTPPVAPKPPPSAAGDSPAAPLPASPPPAASATPRPAPAPAPEGRGGYRPGVVTGAGTIRGFCRIAGDANRPPVEVFKDNEKGCGAKQQPTERLVVGAGGALANCVVSVRGIKAGKDFPPEMRSEDRTFLLDQKGCRYRPHVAVVRVGTQMAVKNSDGADHNIHGYLESFSATKFNFSSPPGSEIPDAASAFLEDPGAYLVKCDIHPWMSAVIHVTTHPYHDVTSADDAPGKKAGEYLIDGVPPGEYEVVCWHEGMEENATMQDGKIASYSYSADVWATQRVQVGAGETKPVDFTLGAPKK